MVDGCVYSPPEVEAGPCYPDDNVAQQLLATAVQYIGRLV